MGVDMLTAVAATVAGLALIGWRSLLALDAPEAMQALDGPARTGGDPGPAAGPARASVSRLRLLEPAPAV